MSLEPSAQIRDFIVGRYPQSSISDDDDIFSLGFVNSLFAMELVIFIESTFEISIPNTALKIDNFRSVNAMSNLVRDCLTAANPA
jgi:methoxymalonate biosynthesis acyl carrier protein